MTPHHKENPPDEARWAQRLERLHDAAVAVAGAHNVDGALQTIVDSAREVAEAEVAALGVPGERGAPMAHFVVSGVEAAAGQAPMGRGVLGVLLHDGQSVRLANLADHPAFEGYPGNHPHIGAFLGVPIRSAGEVIGDLYLGNKIDGREFSETDQRIIEMMAAHAATIIQNLRYQQKAGELARVQEREALGRRLQDDVLQSMYGGGLLLGQIDLSNRADAESKLEAVQSTFGAAIDHLRAHLLALSAPPDESTGATGLTRRYPK